MFNEVAVTLSSIYFSISQLYFVQNYVPCEESSIEVRQYSIVECYKWKYLMSHL